MNRPGGERRLLHPSGTRVGTEGADRWLAVGTVVVAGVVVLSIALRDVRFALAVLGAYPASILMRRGYQCLPSAQQITVVLDRDDHVRVALGRGAVRPLARRLRSGATGRAEDVAGTMLGVLIGAVVPVGVAIVAVLLDQPWIALVFAFAILWLLVELVVRIAATNRRLARGARLGRDELAGQLAVWHAVRGGTWRAGVPREELASVAGAHRDLTVRARELVRPVLEPRPPRSG